MAVLSELLQVPLELCGNVFGWLLRLILGIAAVTGWLLLMGATLGRWDTPGFVAEDRKIVYETGLGLAVWGLAIGVGVWRLP